MNNQSYGIAETATNGGSVGLHMEDIRLNGFTVVAGGEELQPLSRWRELIDLAVEQQGRLAGGEEELRRLGEGNTARAPLHGESRFLALATDPTILAICAGLLDGYFILNQQNAVVNPPNGQKYHQAAYHRDLPYQHFVSSRPIAVSALYCADDFTVENGATMVLQGTHKQEVFPSDALVRRCEHPVVAPAGSYLVFDSMLFHRGGVNHSSSSRRAVNHVYSRPFVKQQIVLPSLLGDGYSSEPAIRRLLGFDCDPPGSVDAWFASRRARLPAD
ncbi:phytanoyl-CoA dioxygenase family protein [Cognatiluteimonas profundi]|uniref:phytanoyl-CoA dioxygenase family protein n=1 Tax=Cognatiluteimonas profundi TaxID=2594501 RepID=UPI00131CDB9B|nr:phytanoyl-CoA dioxygenase family protein [Lysobacter profundi]